MSSTFRYRRDVDGLRAVAVIPIILYHLGSPLFTGGYVGVDVFFVISGFLIGGIVMNDLRAGRFNFSTFWLRRIRRIVPALIATLLTSTLIACFILFPFDLVRFSRSLIFASLSSANIYFMATTNYFSGSAADHPLLHLWSLGVEEQFYLFFPLFLYLVHRRTPGLLGPLTLLSIGISFALSVALLEKKPNAVFYLLPTRAWELLTGFAINLAPSKWLSSAAVRESLALIGLGLVLIALLLFTDSTPFPGSAALLPCGGAALIILAGSVDDTLVTRILKTRVLVWTGLISFSLYLWHWPLIVFIQYALPTPKLNPALQAGVFIGTYVMAFASWRWIENPLRASKANPKTVFMWGGGSLLGVSALGCLILGAQGFPGRYSTGVLQAQRFLAYRPEAAFREGRCFLRPGQDAETLVNGGCLTEAQDRPNVLLLGNSHAAHLWAGLARVAPDINIMQATASGWNCVPLVDFHESPTCDSIWEHVFGNTLLRSKIDLVIISATWEEIQLEPLNRTLMFLRERGIKVLFIGPGPQYSVPLPRLLALSVSRNDPSLPDRYSVDSPRRFDARLQKIAIANGAEFFSAYDALCRTGCAVSVNNAPLLFDIDHLTVEGSSYLAKHILRTRSWSNLSKSRPRTGGQDHPSRALGLLRPWLHRRASDQVESR